MRAQSLFPQMHCIRAGEREARLTALVFAGRKKGQASDPTSATTSSSTPPSTAATTSSSAADAAATPATVAAAAAAPAVGEASDAGDGSDAAAAAADSARIQTFLVRFRESAQVDQFIRCVDEHKGTAAS